MMRPSCWVDSYYRWPGKGKSHDLGYGLNGIGRADSERISLNYGDEEISREGHSA